MYMPAFIWTLQAPNAPRSNVITYPVGAFSRKPRGNFHTERSLTQRSAAFITTPCGHIRCVLMQLTP